MKVLHLNKTDIQGGAARAAYRLHIGLRKIGVDSKMLVDDKVSDDPNVYGLSGEVLKAWGKARPFADRIPLKFYDWQRTPFHPAWIGRNIAGEELAKQADIINLHWIVGGFLSVRGISGLAKLGKPIVWTLHDMWAFTGGCHLSGGCEKYIDSCGACPQLNSHRDNDITRKIWRRKKRVYRNVDLTIVTPSRWMAECAKRSSLFSELKVKVVPNGLNTDIFNSIDKLTARNILNLPKNKKIILFGAVNPATFGRKGFQYLKGATIKLEKIKAFNKGDLCLVIFGVSHFRDIKKIPYEVRFLGRLYDDFSLALSYSAADVFVIPSLQDNLPNTVMESLSCGTPVVAFNIGGMPDMIEHKRNGYLAEEKAPEDLAIGIEWIIVDDERRKKISVNAREKALREYTLKTQAERYVNLYKSLLQNRI